MKTARRKKKNKTKDISKHPLELVLTNLSLREAVPYRDPSSPSSEGHAIEAERTPKKIKTGSISFRWWREDYPGIAISGLMPS